MNKQKLISNEFLFLILMYVLMYYNKQVVNYGGHNVKMEGPCEVIILFTAITSSGYETKPLR